tara:strand:+ start:904 stop:1179 length:276 start_codon:yes stop_codon:yes gene_type:complete
MLIGENEMSENLNLEQVISSLVGELNFKQNKPYLLIDGLEYGIWNTHTITMHTFGYPLMNSTISSIYTAYRKGDVFKASIINGDVYLQERI